MQRIISIKQALSKSILLGILILLSLSLFVFCTPVYAATSEELELIPPKERLLTPEEKIERAYELGEGAGILEEAKQESGNTALINPKAKPNVKSVKSPESARK